MEAIIQKPRIEILEDNGTSGKFVASPLERGFGNTLGNALRRVLLGSLPGAAVTWVKIDGVQHEYSTIPHMKEDAIEFLLNVKTIRLRPLSEREGTLRLEVTGPGVVTAGDIQPSADFEIVNPELQLATLDSPEGRLSVEMNVGQGIGYVPAGSTDGLPFGALPVDAIYTPIRKVNYAVEKTRVGQVTDYEKLTLEVATDGTLTAVEALRQASQLLVDQFFLFCTVGKTLEGSDTQQPIAYSIPAEKYNTAIEKLGLSARTLNCLKRSNIHKVGEVLERSKDELLAIRNFGEKSLTELYERLGALGFISQETVAEILGAATKKAEEETDEEKKVEPIKDLSALKSLLGAEGEDAKK